MGRRRGRAASRRCPATPAPPSLRRTGSARSARPSPRCWCSRLRDEGLLALDDPIGRFVPETGYATASVRDLLAHLSGMQSEPAGSWWERVDGGDFDALVAANDGSGRVAAAGEYFHYSNLGYGLLGEAVARLRGQTWWEAVQERLLVPLGMDTTSYHPPQDHAPGRSVDHFAHTLTAEPHTDTGAMAPAGQARGARSRTCCAGRTSSSPVTPRCSRPTRSPRWPGRGTRRGPTGSACRCCGSASGPSSGTPGRCPGSWPRSSPTGPPATPWSPSRTPPPGCVLRRCRAS
ncbi:serine hydrolase [Nocardioides sp. W3-2-3]|nr:serine hydrolase [Nocardioides convexus]